MPGIEAKVDRSEQMQLRRELPPRPGLRGWLARRMGHTFDRRVNLDQTGTLFWNLIDGERDLGLIAELMADQTDAELVACRIGVVQYTRLLMDRRFLYLVPPTEAQS